MTLCKGTCHCGDIQFEIRSSFEEFTTCDCSICVMRNAVMVKVPEDELIVRSGQDSLALYEWNTGLAKHYFCKTCGIYVFHRKRAAPDHFGVNVFCLQDIDISTVSIRATEGENMTVRSSEDQPHWPGPRI